MAEDLAAGFGNPPATGPRHFGDEATHMEAFQQAADAGTRPAGGLRRAVPFEDTPEVFVAEPLGDVVAVQDGGEQFQIVVAGRVEARRVAAVDSLGFREVGQFAMGGCRVGGMTERLQVSLIAGESVALIVVESDDANFCLTWGVDRSGFVYGDLFSGIGRRRRVGVGIGCWEGGWFRTGIVLVSPGSFLGPVAGATWSRFSVWLRGSGSGG